MTSDESPGDFSDDRTGYDPTTGTYHVRHDWESEQPLVASVVETVAVLTDADPTAMDPLYETIDPDALERVVRSFRQSGERTDGTVRFTFNDRTVVVRSDGEIRVQCDPEGDRSSG